MPVSTALTGTNKCTRASPMQRRTLAYCARNKHVTHAHSNARTRSVQRGRKPSGNSKGSVEECVPSAIGASKISLATWPVSTPPNDPKPDEQRIAPYRQHGVSSLLTLQDCADSAQVSVKSIRRAIASGRLVATRVQGGLRIAPDDWQTYLTACRSAGTVRPLRPEFRPVDGDLVARLSLTPTRRNGRTEPEGRSKIVELAGRRGTR